MTAARVDTVAELRRLMETRGHVADVLHSVPTTDLEAMGAAVYALNRADDALTNAAAAALPALLDRLDALEAVAKAAEPFAEVMRSDAWSRHLPLLRAALARLGS